MKGKNEKKDNFSLHIGEIEKTIGYEFKDKSLLTQAFTRTSFCNEENLHSKVKLQSNEVLEFFGDGVLSLAIITFLMKDSVERYSGGIRTKLTEGDFSTIKSRLSDKKNLSGSIYNLGLYKYLRMGEGDVKLGIETEPSVMEDLFESIVGAIYIDSGMDMEKVSRAVSKMLDMTLYTSEAAPARSAKNLLQEWCQDKKRRLPPPSYKLISKEGPDHKATYEIGCYLGERLIGRGKGKNEKLAGAKAAEEALALLSAEEKKVSPKEDKEKEKASAQETKKNEAKQVSDNEAAASAKLKALAKSKKLLSPAFVDKGASTARGASLHSVECRFDGIVKTGIAPTREKAKEAAAAAILAELSPKKRSKKGQAQSSSPKQSSNVKKRSYSNKKIKK